MTNEQYHKEQDHISSSDIKLFQQNPQRYFKKKSGDYSREPTPAMEFGTMVHDYLEDSESFWNHYFYLDESLRPEPDSTFRKKVNKEWKDNILSANEGKKAISEEDFMFLKHIEGKLESNIIQDIFFRNRDINKEDVYMVSTPEGYNIKAKPDVLSFDHRTKTIDILDYKTISDISRIEKDTKYLKYYLSLAFYKHILELSYPDYSVDHCYLLFFETKNTKEAQLTTLSDETIFRGKIEALDTLEQIHDYEEGQEPIKEIDLFTEEV